MSENQNERPTHCETCNGTGTAFSQAFTPRKCEDCHGKGIAKRPTPITDREEMCVSHAHRLLYDDDKIVESKVSRDLERQIAERTEQRDRLAALVGTIRQWFAIPVRNVNDITPEEHSQEIGEAVDAIKQQRDRLAEALERYDIDTDLSGDEEAKITVTAEDQRILREALAATKGGKS